MLLVNFVLYILAFLLIWFGAGLIVSSVSKFSRLLKLSPFAFSFVFLGILTSTPEFSVGLQAVADRSASIFAGNLLGGLVVLFLVVIPVLAIFGNGIKFKNEFDTKQLITTVGVIMLPPFLILDKKVTNLEGVVMVISYLVLLYLIQRKSGIFDKSNERIFDLKAYSFRDISKILAGLGMVFVASNIIVEKTLYFAGVFNISAFYIGLIIIALGTDLPELTLAIRSVVAGERELAIGDYVGAAAASTLLFGVFTLLHNGEVITSSNFLLTFSFISIALGLFYFFSHKRKFISRLNGVALLLIYGLFVIFELAT